MQVPKDTFFYSKVRADPDGEEDDDDDRLILIEEQKACRARARKYTLETNRRRKALEDRKKQRDIQEQRLRENILQQRKQRLQEATERFQKAPLPPTQRIRSASSVRAPNLDEALSHIQGNQTSCNHHSSSLFGTSTNSRTCTSPPKPPWGSNAPRSLHDVSAAQAYYKLMQERNLGDYKTSQLLFSQLKEYLVKGQEQLQAQEHSDTQISHESLSSLDSLEAHDTKMPTSLQGQKSPIMTHSVPNSFLEEQISQAGLPTSSSPSTSPSPVEDEIQGVQSFFKEPESYNMAGQSKSSNIHSTIPCQKQVSEYHYGTTKQEWILRDKSIAATNCKVQTDPDTIPLESSSMAHMSNPDSVSKFTKHLSQVKATQKASRCLYSTASDLNKISPSLENATIQPVEAEKYFQSTKRKPDENGGVVLERRNHFEIFEKYKRAEHPNLVDKYSNSKLSRAILPKSFKMMEEPDKASHTHTLTNHIEQKNGHVHFLKGILKTKCMEDEDDEFSCIPSHFTFTEKLAKNIKDSLELSYTKGRGPRSNKCTQKKLRWLDEVNSDGEENNEITTKELNKQAKTERRQTRPFQQPLLDQQQSLHSLHVNLHSDKLETTSFGPANPTTAIQAWSDVGPQKTTKQEQTVQSRIENAASGAEHWDHQQTQSAKIGSGNILLQARRGTTIRPKSSSQVQDIVRTHGKLLMPRPPPKSEVNRGNLGQAIMYVTKNDKNCESSQGKARLETEQGLCKDFPGHSLPQHEHNILAPAPPSYVCMYENVSKGIYTICQSNSHVGSGSNAIRKGALNRTPTDEEITLLWHGVRNALASKDGTLDRAPSDEEITLLWHGVRSALSSKDGGTQRLQTHNGPLSALPQTHANLSHVTFTGNNLFSGVANMGDFFLSPSNVRSPERRPTVTNNKLKNRTAASRYRKPPILYQATVPIEAGKTRHIAYDQGSEVIDGDQQVAVDFQKATEILQSQRGLSALSLEEQQLLQSLEGLNHRLQNVQDATAGNKTLKAILPAETAHNQSHQPGKSSCATLRRYRGVSADSRTRPHRRY